MSELTKATGISKKVREEVLKRDNHHCIICGNHNVQIAHYVSRARLGMGIAQNLVCLCLNCHYQFDNGSYHNEIKKAIKDYLRQNYPDWNENKLTYTKWR